MKDKQFGEGTAVPSWSGVSQAEAEGGSREGVQTRAESSSNKAMRSRLDK